MATTWAGTDLNQGITRTAMNDFWNLNTNGGYPWCDGCSQPANSLQLITRAYYEANYVFTSAYGIYLIDTAKTSLQILVKNDIAYPSATLTRLTISAAGVVSGITYDYC
jgi:hypothetical protein